MRESTYRMHNVTGIQPSCIGKDGVELGGRDFFSVFSFVLFVFWFDISFVLSCLLYWVHIDGFGLDFTASYNTLNYVGDNTLFNIYIN